jgi:hypothetical protein
LSALEAGGDKVFVQYLLEQVMHWHLVLFAAFFVEPQPPARTIVIVIVKLKFQYRACRCEVRVSNQGPFCPTADGAIEKGGLLPLKSSFRPSQR